MKRTVVPQLFPYGLCGLWPPTTRGTRGGQSRTGQIARCRRALRGPDTRPMGCGRPARPTTRVPSRRSGLRVIVPRVRDAADRSAGRWSFAFSLWGDCFFTGAVDRCGAACVALSVVG